MITLAFHFPHRRYHATPWGRYVNEGVVELPPAPWRILRALYAAWRARHPELDTDTVHPILQQLAAPPVYHLPPYHLAHTRHYYPDSHHRLDNPSTDKIIDAFAVLGADATIYVTWNNAALTAPQHTALAQLCQAIPYLGRAESTTEARIHHDAVPDSHTACSIALWNDDNTRSEPGTDHVQLLAPDGPLDLDALTLRPADVRATKRRFPPHTQHLPYTIPLPTPLPTPRTRTIPRPRHRVTTVRLTIASRPLPPLTQALAVTDALRAACIKQLVGDDKERLQHPSALAGKNADLSPMRGHRHTHFLPRSTNGKHIDEIVLWIPAGLTDEELTAVHEAARTRTIGVPHDVPGPHNIHMRVTAHGRAEDHLPPEWATPSTRWTSTTPFIPPHHRKKKQELHTYLTAEVTRELAHRGLPAPACVETVAGAWGLHTRHRRTKQETLTTARPAYGLRLTFHEPLTGPLALGHHSHFGLGTFNPTP
ncbi:type I-U CRISPR-associated protein Csb2 [Streptomyces sp. RFCAC02]|uniref:type I-G CRISPR-associated protein Csb2 n=1 Tax=Streptomyces sp. RFCAC02 TaxID=2499143 RepID=UPI00143CE17B|nr:type I-U CRISPR-associated protein Csb2 [Streptomyces sp. RFCAC02]